MLVWLAWAYLLDAQRLQLVLRRWVGSAVGDASYAREAGDQGWPQVIFRHVTTPIGVVLGAVGAALAIRGPREVLLPLGYVVVAGANVTMCGNSAELETGLTG